MRWSGLVLVGWLAIVLMGYGAHRWDSQQFDAALTKHLDETYRQPFTVECPPQAVLRPSNGATRSYATEARSREFG